MRRYGARLRSSGGVYPMILTFVLAVHFIAEGIDHNYQQTFYFHFGSDLPYVILPCETPFESRHKVQWQMIPHWCLLHRGSSQGPTSDNGWLLDRDCSSLSLGPEPALECTPCLFAPMIRPTSRASTFQGTREGGDSFDLHVLPDIRNETTMDRHTRLLQEAMARRVSKAIDDAIKAEKLAKRNKPTIKLLLLGQSESGASVSHKSG